MLLETGHQFEQRHAHSPANLPKFDQVEPSLARFVLGNERLRLVQQLGQVFLPKPRTQPKLTKNKLQCFLFWGEDALLHAPTQSDLISHPNFGYHLWLATSDGNGQKVTMQPSLFPEAQRREVQPFKTQLLKWIGNKQRFAHEIVAYFPLKCGTYYEPFLGSGAVLATLAPESAVGSDVFQPLADIWQALTNSPEELKQWYAERWEQTKHDTKEVVYERVKASYNAKPNGPDLLYLCRSCYGGVVRFRKKDGYMSTPCGVHKPIEPASFSRRADEWRMRCRNTNFLHADYADVMEMAKHGDLVYCDPPYVDTQAILYGSQSFSLAKLFDVIGRCKDRGVSVALSIDGTKRSGGKICNVPIPDGLFETEALVNCGRSMLRRFQMAGQTLENEVVADRLLLTYSLPEA